MSALMRRTRRFCCAPPHWPSRNAPEGRDEPPQPHGIVSELIANLVKDWAMPRSRATTSGSNSGMTRKHRAAGVNLRAGVGTGPQLNLVANSRLVRGRCSLIHLFQHGVKQARH